MPLYPISNFVTMAFFIGILGLLLLQKEMAFALLFACGWVVFDVYRIRNLSKKSIIKEGVT